LKSNKPEDIVQQMLSNTNDKSEEPSRAAGESEIEVLSSQPVVQ
jgi:hypothetical protein